MAKSGQHGGNTREMAEKYGQTAAEILDFSANINPLGMPSALRAALIAQIDCVERYPDIDYQHLHQAIARHHANQIHRSEGGFPASYVVAGNGATELIYQWVLHTQPRHALIVEPTFAEYRQALTRVGCEIEGFVLQESEGFALTERLLDTLHQGLDCLFLCTPNNPTGLMPEADLLQRIVTRTAQLGIRLFVDESFIDFLPQHRGLTDVLEHHPHLFVLRSMTKFYAIPGLRLGYLLSANQPVLAALRNQREPWTINAFAALAGEILFTDDGYAEQTYHWLHSEQSYLFQGLSQLPGLTVYPPAANYIFFRLHRADFDLQHALMQRNILIRHCANYRGLSPQYYRVAIRARAENQQLLRALRDVLAPD
ncbi:Threonine-phosphate decarboxylase [Vibrio ruber DSM 16370]|uniref:threonine-phosphate decarboxylase n=1 Tax=Vibrio ruber (strain DSM 16370 / JCM 11486 / BCRC 17186 / CECT 7878 / LMG 23124 / VR1) TaxID=1123498 RepID=A0A1R4L900_VIBR1|nr:threonine-phosphate decarboxylase CobD [Vibrio ruber]SJN52853.1 Threonine-phosphate decarboxylase [Vibrio ruber DSM 16370]